MALRSHGWLRSTLGFDSKWSFHFGLPPVGDLLEEEKKYLLAKKSRLETSLLGCGDEHSEIKKKLQDELARVSEKVSYSLNTKSS